jgi:hypothetical protein
MTLGRDLDRYTNGLEGRKRDYESLAWTGVHGQGRLYLVDLP